ncbi:MAG: exosortase/archaeosortase family protein [Gemmataceae bacterium]|nr:exosortase/archaeosortase family protein [Gemmataceae bacterium]
MRSEQRYSLTLTIGLGALLLWCYWSSLAEVSERWANDPQYTQGFLIPGFALAVLWARRRQLPAGPQRGSWWAVPLVALGMGLRLVSTHYHLESLELLSLIPCVAGVCLAVGGWPLLRWAWPAVAFLVFMLPLPHRVEVALSNPLRRLATMVSAYLLQAMGFPTVAEENVILVDEVRIGVVEACSGLGMIMTLSALTLTVTFFCDRPRWEKVVIVLSAVPIALVANVLRITLTGVLYGLWDSTVADVFFHDLAGWVMMPVALGLLWLEFQILSRLFIEVAPPVPEFLSHNRQATTSNAPRPVGSQGAVVPAEVKV